MSELDKSFENAHYMYIDEIKYNKMCQKKIEKDITLKIV